MPDSSHSLSHSPAVLSEYVAPAGGQAAAGLGSQPAAPVGQDAQAALHKVVGGHRVAPAGKEGEKVFFFFVGGTARLF